MPAGRHSPAGRLFAQPLGTTGHSGPPAQRTNDSPHAQTGARVIHGRMAG